MNVTVDLTDCEELDVLVEEVTRPSSEAVRICIRTEGDLYLSEFILYLTDGQKNHLLQELTSCGHYPPE